MSTVYLDRRTRDVIEREGTGRRLSETGGSIFGWRQGTDIVVACASGPGPQARHRPRSFSPGPGVTQRVMDAVYDASDGRYGYLGSWHTHPLAAAVPSGIDRATARRIATQPSARQPQPLLLIMSTTGTRRHVRPAELRAWLWLDGAEQLLEVPVEAVELAERRVPPDAALFVTAQRPADGPAPTR